MNIFSSWCVERMYGEDGQLCVMRPGQSVDSVEGMMIKKVTCFARRDKKLEKVVATDTNSHGVISCSQNVEAFDLMTQ